jgi:hypothetical protein
METKELIDLLRQQAKEIADANMLGWGNTMMLAAERLEELEAGESAEVSEQTCPMCESKGTVEYWCTNCKEHWI